MNQINANWPAPKNVIAGVTLRTDGVSLIPYASNNFALHVGDNAEHVLRNRQVLDSQLPHKKQWQWLEQVHGVNVVNAPTFQVSIADAVFSAQKNTVCTVLTADCLPILLCDRQGNQVAAIHAGWRSLCAGIIENTIARFSGSPEQIMAWLGPAIGAEEFEVGIDVVDAFLNANCGEQSRAAFKPTQNNGKYLADIYHLAKIRLNSLGLNTIYGGEFCTVKDKDKFYSYRREGVTGRMVSFIYSI